MRVIIVRAPKGVLNGMPLEQWQVGRTYDLPSSIAAVMVLEGLARLEMRSALADRRRKAHPESQDRRNYASR